MLNGSEIDVKISDLWSNAKNGFVQPFVVGFIHRLVCTEQVMVGTFLFFVCWASCGQKKSWYGLRR